MNNLYKKQKLDKKKQIYKNYKNKLYFAKQKK